MTRTENDLRAMYAAAESTHEVERKISNWIEHNDWRTSGEPILLDLEPVTSASRSRRRWLTTGAVAAAVAALVVTITALTGVDGTRPASRAGNTPVPTRAELLPTWHFTVAKVAGYTVVRDRILRIGPITSVQQAAAITATTGRVTGTVELSEGGTPGYQSVIAHQKHGPGGRGQPVHINGHTGYFSPGSPVTASAIDPWAAAGDSQPQLTWRLSSDSWASIDGTFGYQPATNTWDDAAALHAMTLIGRALRYGKIHQPVTMPFRLTGVPTHLVPEAVRAFSKPRAQCLSYGEDTATSIDVGSNGSVFTICRADTRHDSTPDRDSAFGSLQQVDTTIATRDLADGTTLSIVVDQLAHGEVSRSQAVRLLKHADVTATFDRPAAWLDVT